MPKQVRQKFGAALQDAQVGKKHRKAKSLAGFGGANVLEVVEDFDTNTYRAVYTVRFVEAVYVLHVFQKKSRAGIATPQADMTVIRARLHRAEERHQEYLEKQRQEE